MTFKILSLFVGLFSILVAWVMSAVFLWGARGSGTSYSLFDVGEILGAFLLVLNFLFQIFLAWKMFSQDTFLHSRGFTFLAPIIFSALIVGYNFALGAIKPLPEIVTEHPGSSQQDLQEKRE